MGQFSQKLAPLALTCGEPAGKARKSLPKRACLADARQLNVFSDGDIE